MDNLTLFRRNLSQALRIAGVRWRVFANRYDLEKLEADTERIDDAREFAAIVLEMFCRRPVRPGTCEFAVVIAVVRFLDERLGKPNDPNGQRLDDLNQIIPNSRQQYLSWAKGWY